MSHFGTLDFWGETLFDTDGASTIVPTLGDTREPRTGHSMREKVFFVNFVSAHCDKVRHAHHLWCSAAAVVLNTPFLIFIIIIIVVY